MKVLVVGGVAAGMSAAARLRRLDESAEIIVFEKDEFVSFANCGLPYHIGGTIAMRGSLLVQTPQSLKEQLNLDVRVFSEVTAIHPGKRTVEVHNTKTGEKYTEAYDKLILAPGAKPLRPPMPGLDHPAIFELRNIADMDRIINAVKSGAKRAVVMGGFIGIETAENLRELGLEVIIVEKMPQLMGPLDPEIAYFLQAELERHGVRVLTGAGVNGFRDEDGRVIVMLENGVRLETDIVIFAIGSVPFSDLAREAGLELTERGAIAVDSQMRTSDPDIFAAGDVVETPDFITGKPCYVPLAGPANRQGRIVADVICGRDSHYRSTQGTSVLKVFDLTVANTGLNEKSLNRASIPFEKVYLHPFGHASYYPGTAQMHVKMLFSPDGERILGAQIAGYDGVDKRIDVFATAMRGNLSVHDLEHLELAYAPPYGAAKDPVNMAGFIAGNIINGDIEFWNSEDFGSLPPDAVVVDVRTPEEFTAWHIPKSVNMPLDSLRARVGKLDQSKLYYVYCKVGIRSYFAQRILKAHGLRCKNLAGGSDTLQSFHPELAPRPSVGPSVSTPNIAGPCEVAPTDSGEPPPAAHIVDARGVCVVEGEPAATATGNVIKLDCRGLQCPGPLRRMSEEIKQLEAGDELEVLSSDIGFLNDAQAWCLTAGHHFIEGGHANEPSVVRCRIRKRSTDALSLASQPDAAAATARQSHAKKKSMVLFSGDMDKVMAALIIANGALAMGDEVTIFFTFWGLSALRKEKAPPIAGKPLLDRMFGWMLPSSIRKLKLSQMDMMGMGRKMMRHVMRTKNVDTPQELLAQAQQAGVRLVACSMSLDVMGLKPEELIEGIELGGVAAFLADANASNATLFI